MNWKINELSSDDCLFIMANALSVIAEEIAEGDKETLENFLTHTIRVALYHSFLFKKEDRTDLTEKIKKGLAIQYQNYKASQSENN